MPSFRSSDVQILLSDGTEVGCLDMVVSTSALGAMCRWRVRWGTHFDMVEATTTWDSLHAAQQYVEGVVERQERLAALERL